MTTMWIGDLNQYRAVREMFDIYCTDISSADCTSPFKDYWNRRIDSPIMCYIIGATKVKVTSHDGSYYVPLQLKFNSDEEQTFWLLQNS